MWDEADAGTIGAPLCQIQSGLPDHSAVYLKLMQKMLTVNCNWKKQEKEERWLVTWEVFGKGAAGLTVKPASGKESLAIKKS